MGFVNRLQQRDALLGKLRQPRPADSDKRLRVFCASMADVFDKDAPPGTRERLWRLIKATPHLDWLVLTKRISNAPRMLPADWGSGYRNVWLGISVVNQAEAERDIPKLVAIEARIRFLSCEPLLGPMGALDLAGGVHWVIGGGESGPRARVMRAEWARELRDECVRQGAAFFWKQWGSTRFNPIFYELPTPDCSLTGAARVARLDPIGKGGSLLDGCEIKQFPE